MNKIVLSILFFACTNAAARADADWTNWRGPAMTGASDARGLPTTWSDDKNILWKSPLPHWAGASPVVADGRIYVMTASKSEPDDKAEVGRKLGRTPVNVSDAGGKDVALLCFDQKSGERLWERRIASGNRFYAKHNMASPSPVTDGRHVWAMTGTGVVACFTANGDKSWEYDLQKEHGEFGLYWGYASSPSLYDDMLIVQVLHGATTKNPSYLLALDKMTGKKKWYVERKTDATQECPDAYTTPVLLTHDGKTSIIVSGADWVTAHDAATGAKRWRATGLNPEKEGNYRICGTPLAVDGLVIATSRIQPIMAIRAGGTGDVTKSHTAWTYADKKGPDVPSAACDGKYVYLINDKGFATCIDAKTGKAFWGPERIERGPYSASPLVADGKVYITNEDCVTTVLKVGDAFEVLATNRLDGGYTLSSWAVADGRMYLRAEKYLYCIGK
jgi:outer membrane protein assembly factor BamB